MASNTVDPTLLNVALNLCLEFGPNWRKSIAERLLQQRPELERSEADGFARLAAETRDWAHGLVESCVLDKVSTVSETRGKIIAAFPWIDGPTLERLWNQGCYYAMKR